MDHHHHEQQKYTCPMHPEVVKDGPGQCPICGMNLVPVGKQKEQSNVEIVDLKHVNHQEHDEHNPPMGHEGHDHHAMMIGDFKKRFYVEIGRAHV